MMLFLCWVIYQILFSISDGCGTFGACSSKQFQPEAFRAFAISVCSLINVIVPKYVSSAGCSSQLL